MAVSVDIVYQKDRSFPETESDAEENSSKICNELRDIFQVDEDHLLSTIIQLKKDFDQITDEYKLVIQSKSIGSSLSSMDFSSSIDSLEEDLFHKTITRFMDKLDGSPELSMRTRMEHLSQIFDRFFLQYSQSNSAKPDPLTIERICDEIPSILIEFNRLKELIDRFDLNESSAEIDHCSKLEKMLTQFQSLRKSNDDVTMGSDRNPTHRSEISTLNEDFFDRSNKAKNQCDRSIVSELDETTEKFPSGSQQRDETERNFASRINPNLNPTVMLHNARVEKEERATMSSDLQRRCHDHEEEIRSLKRMLREKIEENFELKKNSCTTLPFVDDERTQGEQCEKKIHWSMEKCRNILFEVKSKLGVTFTHRPRSSSIFFLYLCFIHIFIIDFSWTMPLVFREVSGDLFSVPSDVSLAHCVSEDFSMSKGIAKLFRDRFARVDELKSQNVTKGGCALLRFPERCVFYQVTKEKYFHKPTMATLRSSLEAMRTLCLEHRIRSLAMPRIGCGLDKLVWERVAPLIQEVFADVEMEITIYSL